MQKLIGVVIAGVLSLFVMPVLTMAFVTQVCTVCTNVAATTIVTPSASTNPSASASAPGHGATPPGQGGTPPGQAKQAEPDPDAADATGFLGTADEVTLQELQLRLPAPVFIDGRP